jgi:hypothetical protein
VFSLAVESSSALACDHASHEVIARAFAVLADAPGGVLPVGRHERLNASGGEVLDLLACPVAGVCERRLDLLLDARRSQLSG